MASNADHPLAGYAASVMPMSAGLGSILIPTPRRPGPHQRGQSVTPTATPNAGSALTASRVDGVIMRGHVLGPGRGLLCAFGPAGRSDLRTRDRPCFSIHKPATSTSQTSQGCPVGVSREAGMSPCVATANRDRFSVMYASPRVVTCELSRRVATG